MCVTFLGKISLIFSFWFIRNAVGFESTTTLRFSTAFIMTLKTVKLQRERPLKQQNCEMNVGILLPRVTAGVPFKSRGCRKEFEESFISNPSPLRAFNKKKNALAYPWRNILTLSLWSRKVVLTNNYNQCLIFSDLRGLNPCSLQPFEKANRTVL